MAAASIAIEREVSSGRLRRALLATWLVTAGWDFVFASALAVFGYDSTVARLWQGVASTVLGARAAQLGGLGVAAGLALHLTVALTWSALFVALLARSDTLRRVVRRPSGAAVVAVAYGPAIWLAMSCLVIPLATGRPPSFGFRWWVQLFA